MSDYLLITFTATSPGHHRKLSSHWINPTLHLALKPDRNQHTHKSISDGCIIYAAAAAAAAAASAAAAAAAAAAHMVDKPMSYVIKYPC